MDIVYHDSAYGVKKLVFELNIHYNGPIGLAANDLNHTLVVVVTREVNPEPVVIPFVLDRELASCPVEDLFEGAFVSDYEVESTDVHRW